MYSRQTISRSKEMRALTAERKQRPIIEIKSNSPEPPSSSAVLAQSLLTNRQQKFNFNDFSLSQRANFSSSHTVQKTASKTRQIDQKQLKITKLENEIRTITMKISKFTIPPPQQNTSFETLGFLLKQIDTLQTTRDQVYAQISQQISHIYNHVNAENLIRFVFGESSNFSFQIQLSTPFCDEDFLQFSPNFKLPVNEKFVQIAKIYQHQIPSITLPINYSCCIQNPFSPSKFTTPQIIFALKTTQKQPILTQKPTDLVQIFNIIQEENRERFEQQMRTEFFDFHDDPERSLRLKDEKNHLIQQVKQVKQALNELKLSKINQSNQLIRYECLTAAIVNSGRILDKLVSLRDGFFNLEWQVEKVIQELKKIKNFSLAENILKERLRGYRREELNEAENLKQGRFVDRKIVEMGGRKVMRSGHLNEKRTVGVVCGEELVELRKVIKKERLGEAEIGYYD